MSTTKAEPSEIVYLISSGPKEAVHETASIEKLVNECDAVSVAHWIDATTGLTVADLCRVILPRPPSNLDKICHRGTLQVLKSCEIFGKLGIVDGILSIISEYVQNADFSIEYESKPRSLFNSAYYCDIPKVTLSKHLISIHIEEHGDMSLGRLQYPIASKLKSRAAKAHIGGKDIKYTSFYEYDIKYKVSGVVTYEWKHLHLLSKEQLLDITFTYGSGGYGAAKLFNAQNESHCQMIEDFLFYYAS